MTLRQRSYAMQVHDWQAKGHGVTQTIMYSGPDGPPGNCMQAAVASLLGYPLDKVPHFAAEDDWEHALVGWASLRGYRVLRRNRDQPVEFGIGVGPSPRGVYHAVVIRNNVTVWDDPHPSRLGLCKTVDILEFIWKGDARNARERLR